MKDVNKREKRKQWEKKGQNTKIQICICALQNFSGNSYRGELFRAYTDSVTSLGKVLEKPKCPVSIQWKILLYFWKSRLRDGEKDEKVSKTLHKTSQKEDWDQPQPWCFVAPTMSLSQWPTGGVRVWIEKLNRAITRWEANGKVNKNNIKNGLYAYVDR